ncbi:hypothetical protein ACFQ3N_16930 [Virgibacillus byunsanensis]|uniref:Uncharacterized protein n=1 Tax=Virgibacillus byunsanensis TaxID=570945 RepID=A0ABW3LSR4_9BACI
MTEQELYHRIFELKEQLGNVISEYWNLYSGPDTWYFWFNVATVIIPLIILLLIIDKKRIFEISFFGYTIHVIWANIDNILSMNNYFVYPHSLTHLLPVGVTITAVLLPIVFMLIYQYCTNNDRNYYIYALIGSAIFAYGFGYFSLSVDLLRVHKGMNLTYLFLIDVAVMYIAFWATKLFLKLQPHK